MKKILDNLLSVIALFIPMPISRIQVVEDKLVISAKTKWCFSFQIGGVPLGWIMIAVALIF